MADWTFTPEYTYNAKLAGERQLTNVLEDFSELRAEKGSTVSGTYIERYRVTATQLTSMLAFFKTYRLTNSFTKLTYDPGDVGFDPDDPASATGPEETVRFQRWPSWTNTTRNDYTIQFTFVRLPNE